MFRRMSDASDADARRIENARRALAGFTPTGVDASGRTHKATQVVRDGKCPKCGGEQFKARRSGRARFGIGGATVATGGLAGAVAFGATKKTKVECVTCGTVYDRG